MITKRGSQNREPISESGMHVAGWKDKDMVILQDNDDSSVFELWAKNDDHAGYTIDINGEGYEFVRTVRQ